MSTERRLELRDTVKEMFNHSFSGYMTHAFPKDELDPISCCGLSRNSDPTNWGVNDILGNFSLTLIDSLDMFVVVGDNMGFDQAVQSTLRTVKFDFDLDSRVQVFEVTIRVLGGLISAHIFASEPQYGFSLGWYNNELLDMAIHLADRLMPAFATESGLPWPRVNLRRGVLKNEVQEACTAGAGTLILEFGTLSRLTGDPKYENAAKKALLEVWRRRSKLNLVGTTMSLTSDEWLDKTTGIGASSDSFHEVAKNLTTVFI